MGTYGDYKDRGHFQGGHICWSADDVHLRMGVGDCSHWLRRGVHQIGFLQETKRFPCHPQPSSRSLVHQRGVLPQGKIVTNSSDSLAGLIITCLFLTPKTIAHPSLGLHFNTSTVVPGIKETDVSQALTPWRPQCKLSGLGSKFSGCPSQYSEHSPWWRSRDLSHWQFWVRHGRVRHVKMTNPPVWIPTCALQN